MKKKFFILLLSAIILSCSNDDDSSNIQNGFSVNGSDYSTTYAYNRADLRSIIVSSADRTLDSYTEDRGHFEIDNSGDNLVPGIYSTNNGLFHGVVEFDKNIIKEDGNFVSLGDTLGFTCCAETGSNNFQSASVTINSVDYNSDGRITYINMDYTFNWEGIEIKGNYNGEVDYKP